MIGKFRKSLSLEQEALVPDGAGGLASSWTVVATLWGYMEPIGAAALFHTRNLEKRCTHLVTVRYRPDIQIQTGMRLSLGSRTFMIRAIVNQDERNRFIEMMVEEGGLLGA
jgi:SPP1 family predicted phage head-tail adaptor